MSRKWLDTRSVIPAKAGIQLMPLWIPAFAGKTIVGRECRTISLMLSYLQDSTLGVTIPAARRPNLEAEWRFSFPTGITFDPAKNRLIVTDCQRGRLQIYNKLKDYVQPSRTL